MTARRAHRTAARPIGHRLSPRVPGQGWCHGLSCEIGEIRSDTPAGLSEASRRAYGTGVTGEVTTSSPTHHYMNARGAAAVRGNPGSRDTRSGAMAGLLRNRQLAELGPVVLRDRHVDDARRRDQVLRQGLLSGLEVVGLQRAPHLLRRRGTPRRVRIRSGLRCCGPSRTRGIRARCASPAVNGPAISGQVSAYSGRTRNFAVMKIMWLRLLGHELLRLGADSQPEWLPEGCHALDSSRTRVRKWRDARCGGAQAGWLHSRRSDPPRRPSVTDPSGAIAPATRRSPTWQHGQRRWVGVAAARADLRRVCRGCVVRPRRLCRPSARRLPWSTASTSNGWPSLPQPGTSWTTAVGALLDAVDIVALRPPARPVPGDVRRLAARARNRDAVLMPFQPGIAANGDTWPGADVRLSAHDGRWTGIGAGYGRLRQRRLTVTAEGRRVGGSIPVEHTLAAGRRRRGRHVRASGPCARPDRSNRVTNCALPRPRAVIPPPRTVAVWCPDWPVTAARLSADLPADTEVPTAVITANRVIACSHAARVAGVRRGLRRREAQARCPNLAVFPRDELAEARTFEPVVLALSPLPRPSRSPGLAWPRSGFVAPRDTSEVRPGCCTPCPGR